MPATLTREDFRSCSQIFKLLSAYASGSCAQLEYRFVGGALTLVEQPRPDSPHQRVKPEQSFDQHVNQRCEIVDTSDMAQLVGDGFLTEFLTVALTGEAAPASFATAARASP